MPPTAISDSTRVMPLSTCSGSLTLIEMPQCHCPSPAGVRGEGKREKRERGERRERERERERESQRIGGSGREVGTCALFEHTVRSEERAVVRTVRVCARERRGLGGAAILVQIDNDDAAALTCQGITHRAANGTRSSRYERNLAVERDAGRRWCGNRSSSRRR